MKPVRCTSFACIANGWAVKESFKFSKECLGWEEVQLLNLTGIRTLVALAWVRRLPLRTRRHVGVGRSATARPLQQLVARKDNKPGKIVLTRGLRRLLDMLVTQQLLATYEAEHGGFPRELPPGSAGRPRPICDLMSVH